ncbi:inverse autotransporter beta domain-containing protein [Candidatus Pseudothioglobus singularis]|nr:inverse autotransporter beta domain-containing protein [Candidatus Pseudothioglobus singularis]MDA8692170.1 inverse autotransporter beta domain-containing protein [Candidatus Pseudothioglobus singularis]MDB4823097.1 inverse autotransporter beta domain-containing protein [Candidatus Pseudothioglobus singularis]
MQKPNATITTIALSAVFTMSLGLSISVNADDSEQIKSSLMSRMTSSASSFVSTGIGALLSPNFDTVEVSTNLKEGDSSVDIGVLKAYGDNPNSFLFNQINLNRYDDRTTLNLGLGYRRLNEDETWMTGVNAFYDHEFPDDHKRNGVGFEVVSSVLESRVNIYNGTTGYKKDKSGTDSKALDGRDMGFKVALPYMPGMKFGMNAFAWKGIDGMKDKKGRKYTLGGNLSDNLSLEYIRTDYKDATTKDNNSIALNYTWNFGQDNTQPKLFEFSSTAYELSKLGDERYALVKRENRIVKKLSASVTLTGI